MTNALEVEHLFAGYGRTTVILKFPEIRWSFFEPDVAD